LARLHLIQRHWQRFNDSVCR